jgi:hypothetical protein
MNAVQAMIYAEWMTHLLEARIALEAMLALNAERASKGLAQAYDEEAFDNHRNEMIARASDIHERMRMSL